MKSDKSEAPKPAGLFISTLQALDAGVAIAQLDEAILEATKAVRDLGTKAKLTLSLTVIQNGQGVGGVPLVAIDYDIATKLPKEAKKACTFYVTDEGAPSRRDPGQTTIPGLGKLELESMRVEPGEGIAAASGQ